MSNKINCVVCYCELKRDEEVYEDYRHIPDTAQFICEECHISIRDQPLITKLTVFDS